MQSLILTRSIAIAARSTYMFNMYATHSLLLIKNNVSVAGLNGRLFSGISCLHYSMTCHKGTKFLSKKVGNEVYYNNTKRDQHSAADFELHEMELLCNEDKWHEYPQAIRVRSQFIDTHYHLPTSKQNRARTILGIHGTPGSHEDLLPLLKPFADKGYRIVIANLPGSKYTKIPKKNEKYFFTHSLMERADFLIYFLSQLEVKNIDVAVGHCTGTGPLSMLIAHSDLIKSSLYLCPIPGGNPLPALGDMALLQKFLNAYDRPIFKPPVWLYMIWLFKQANILPESIQPKHLHYILQALVYYGYDDLVDLSMIISKKRVPLTYVFSSEDPIVGKGLSVEYAEMMGVTPQATILFDKDADNNEYFNATSRKSVKRGILFQSESHSPQEDDSYLKAIAKEIELLLSQVQYK